jgi:hypothetical protein
MWVGSPASQIRGSILQMKDPTPVRSQAVDKTRTLG